MKTFIEIGAVSVQLHVARNKSKTELHYYVIYKINSRHKNEINKNKHAKETNWTQYAAGITASIDYNA